MTLEAAAALSSMLTEAMHAAVAELLPEGWQFEGVAPRFLMAKHLPVLAFRHGNDTLCFIVSPTDPGAPAFKRSKRYDLTYFSEDVPDAKQGIIYRRDKEFIERVAAWLRRWDA